MKYLSKSDLDLYTSSNFDSTVFSSRQEFFCYHNKHGFNDMCREDSFKCIKIIRFKLKKNGTAFMPLYILKLYRGFQNSFTFHLNGKTLNPKLKCYRGCSNFFVIQQSYVSWISVELFQRYGRFDKYCDYIKI